MNTSGVHETIKSAKNKFYIGDPCYALKENYYSAWIKCGKKREKEEGQYCNDGKLVVNKIDIMISDSTAYGDGYYDGFAVDAGALSVIPWEFVDAKKLKRNGEDLGTIIEVKKNTAVKFSSHKRDGSFHFMYTDKTNKPCVIDIDTAIVNSDDIEDDYIEEDMDNEYDD